MFVLGFDLASYKAGVAVGERDRFVGDAAHEWVGFGRARVERADRGVRVERLQGGERRVERNEDSSASFAGLLRAGTRAWARATEDRLACGDGRDGGCQRRRGERLLDGAFECRELGRSDEQEGQQDERQEQQAPGGGR
jgi:hypothetical protein